MATPPRQILRGTTYSVIKRCISCTYRLVPTVRVTKIVEYCLALAASKTGVSIHSFTFMSNHFHMVLSDPNGLLPLFMQTLDSLLTRNLNALRGISGANFERGYTARIITDIDTAIEQASYTLANPVAADLVKHARHWKGATSVRMDFGQARTIKRPRASIWRDVPTTNPKRRRKRRQSTGRMKRRNRCTSPETLKLVLEPFPKSLTSRRPEDVMKAIRVRVEQREEDAKQSRIASGRTVMSMQRVREQAWWDFPGRLEDLFVHVPRVAGDDPDRVFAAEQRNREFEAEYKAAMELVRKGERPEFPEGTWLMVRRYGYACAGS